ncbi:myotubularin-related protein 9-like isoform X2 [Actinia tenebrosa]|uniref:Myotubularin-related protein 9-like isoform X2 n=1 Tax=Actinia tenebrosa TaxID=6105 RepID=A0A6P8HCE9_ACTTE|nr:myotubularin-related protein 9-like isoform X2 [Actinia tenebrosa]
MDNSQFITLLLGKIVLLFNLLHSAVESIEKKILSGEQAILTICCKNFDLVKLEFSNTEEALNVASSIEDLSVIDDSSLKYPFFYRHLQSLSEEDGWDMFSTDIEFSMMCTSTQNWRISHVNRDYKVHWLSIHYANNMSKMHLTVNVIPQGLGNILDSYSHRYAVRKLC